MLFTPRNWKTFSALLALALLLTAGGCRIPKQPFPASGAVAGWQKTSDTRIYAAKDLWQYIDGDAEQYLSAGVVSASTSDYKYQDGLEAAVDIFTMGNTAGAAKIFGSNSEKGGRSVPLGDQGIAYSQSVTFRKGPYLVHIVGYESTSDAPQALLALAHGVETKL